MNQQTRKSLIIRAGRKQQFSPKELTLLDDKHKYTIGCSQNNDLVLDWLTILPTHFEIDCSSLQIPQNQKEFQNEYFKVLNSFYLEKNIIDKIGEFTITDEKNIKITDISGQKGLLSLINIDNQCKNQVLIKNNTFLVGLSSKLKVRQDNQIFGDFLDKEDLYEFTQRTQIIGLPQETKILFDQSFKKETTISYFQQKLKSKELENELNQLRLKNCIYLEINEKQSIQKYLLVENERNYFSLGRCEQSDIIFKSKQVSSRHGFIKYMDKNWIIFDGQPKSALDGKEQWLEGNINQELVMSKFGIWLEMNPRESFVLGNGQTVKYEDNELTIFWEK
ncbi:unnamed protein product [Paramecium sonneborni]|uniref:FHA domain-containing protein n=1 Tax=Paramecium sonneborni TaxID=65129 RepID=A0A8S1PN31_9CILI|nr:unnamed protein product [Paramecium sonneborni]